MLRSILLAVALASSTGANAAGFDPLAFFSGSTRGDGTVKIIMRSSEPFKVESRGQADGKGGFVLDQVVQHGSKPPKRRRWFLREVAHNNWVGTISDSPGPVRGRIVGNSLVLDYPMKGGLRAEQVMTPEGNGRTVRNNIVVRKLGIIVAKVHEIIRKLD